MELSDGSVGLEGLGEPPDSRIADLVGVKIELCDGDVELAGLSEPPDPRVADLVLAQLEVFECDVGLASALCPPQLPKRPADLVLREVEPQRRSKPAQRKIDNAGKRPKKTLPLLHGSLCGFLYPTEEPTVQHVACRRLFCHLEIHVGQLDQHQPITSCKPVSLTDKHTPAITVRRAGHR